ncbi:SpoIIE family protein phosphatase [Streptomyces sp. V1I1]|uniref:SpoIIE family protein phosphatase n=1 Tax=Streptomyces sp. V1I1 TaxID=3042272 RepID=UPI0027817D51|nr:SpoIIE family protein phosphatase [Streptomyces sp. V1I1]MDQ0945839.1 PAS domain S-box-containing protein [Streptomyces sp. V1I1]
MERLPTPAGERPDESDACPGAAYTATATVNEQGIVTGWSEGARRLLGYPPSEVVGQAAARLLADDVDETARREAARRDTAGRERWSGTVALLHRDGHRLQRPLLAHRRTPDSGIAEWLVVSAVAGRPRTPGSEALREWTFTQSPDILAIFDADLRLVRANTAMERALSLTEDQMRGLRLPEIAPYPVSEEAQSKMRLALESGEPQQVEAYIRPTGVSPERGWPTSLAPLKDPDGRVRAVCLTAHSGSGEYLAPRPYTRERTTTMTLQRSLLPHTLPDQAALEIASRYLPAGTQAGVGGDWFDVIPLSGARVALVVGDVVGHGIRASATMGRLRTAVRTLADVELPPDELLTHLDDLVIHLSADESGTQGAAETAGGIGTTCLYAVYDPVSRHCTLARAGHPPPAVVTPDGAVYFLDVPAGPPLGLGGLPFETMETQLPEGSLIALYTDGLLEPRHHDIDEALDKMFQALAHPAPTLDTVCDRVLTTLLTHRPDDDIALLIARTRALHADKVATWHLPCDPAIVAQARKNATDQLTAWGLDDATFITELTVSELVTNAIRYGKPPIQLRLIHADTTLICEVYDSSNTAPHQRRARTYDEGGRGLLLVAQLAHRWGTRNTPIGKTIWAEQTLTTD